MPFNRVDTLRSSSGASLRLYTSHAEGPVTGVVHINHGLAEHAGRYARFAEFLSQHGFHCYAHDHRGHGGTVAPGAPTGSFGPGAPAALVLEDVRAVHEQIRNRHPALPLVLFGHSMGAIIALAFLLQHGARGVHAAALWNMPLSTPVEARAALAILAWERFRLGSDVPSRLMPKLTFRAWARAVPDGQTPFDWLSRDRTEVAKYIADPHCGWNASIGLWRTLFDLTLLANGRPGAEAIPKSLPFHLVGGGADPSTRYGAIVKRLERQLRREGFSNLQTRIYAGNRHESLNEITRDAVMGDFVFWAKRALA